MLSIGLTHAWNWTDSRSKLVIHMGNFWLVINAFVITAYLAALAGRVPLIAALVAIAVAASALVFLVFFRRMRGTFDLGEQALVELEKVVADELNIDALRLTSKLRTQAERPYNSILPWVLYPVAAVGWFVAAVYAILRI